MMQENCSSRAAIMVSADFEAISITIPPLTVLCLLVAALLILSVSTQPEWWRYHVMCTSSARHNFEQTSDQQLNHRNKAQPAFHTQDEQDILGDFIRHQNKPMCLIKLALPAILSVAFCPLTLFLYKPMMHFFWPDNDMPNVNEAISCFLTPAGLVYAIAFGFAFQEAQTKQGKAENMIVTLDTNIKQIRLLAMTSNLDRSTQLTVIMFLKKEIMLIVDILLAGWSHTRQQTLMATREVRYEGVIRAIQTKNIVTDCKSSMSEKLMDQILLLHTKTSHKHLIVSSTLPALQWIFLETLGFFSFFGILLVEAMSPRLQLTMCMLTVFSVSMFCYVLADLDQPHHGVFRVDLSVFCDSLDRLKTDWDHVTDPDQQGVEEITCIHGTELSD